MADAAFVEIYTGNISTEAQLTFPSVFEKNLAPGAVEPIAFSVGRTPTQLRVDFGRSLRDLAATTVITNYVITGPSSLTVTDVSFTPNNTYLYLDYTGTVVSGTYTLTLASQTVQARNDDQYNVTTGANFEGLVVVLKSSGFNPGLNKC
jgi:hypothetical protein